MAIFIINNFISLKIMLGTVDDDCESAVKCIHVVNNK